MENTAEGDVTRKQSRQNEIYVSPVYYANRSLKAARGFASCPLYIQPDERTRGY